MAGGREASGREAAALGKLGARENLPEESKSIPPFLEGVCVHQANLLPHFKAATQQPMPNRFHQAQP